MSGDDERRADEVLAPVPEHERFRRLEEMQEEQQPGRRGAGGVGVPTWPAMSRQAKSHGHGPRRHRDEPSGEEQFNEVAD